MNIIFRMPDSNYKTPETLNIQFPSNYQPLVGDIITKDFPQLGDYKSWKIVSRELYHHMWSSDDLTTFECDDSYITLVLEDYIVEGS